MKVPLSADPEFTVPIHITATNQGGASSSDYSGAPASLTFNSGKMEKTVSFSSVSDSVEDDGESVKLAFGTLPGSVSAGTTGEATVAITDNDDPQVLITFEQILHRGRGQQRQRQGVVERRPGAHGHHPHHQDQPMGAGPQPTTRVFRVPSPSISETQRSRSP